MLRLIWSLLVATSASAAMVGMSAAGVPLWASIAAGVLLVGIVVPLDPRTEVSMYKMRRKAVNSARNCQEAEID